MVIQPSDCCVCYESNTPNYNVVCYKQHPLCNHCYLKLNVKLCPVCKSYKQNPTILVNLIKGPKFRCYKHT